MNNVVLIIPFCPKPTEIAVHNYVIQRAAWWHYGTDVWCLCFNQEVSTAVLRNEIGGLVPGIQFMVMGVPNSHGNWHGFGPNNWQEWFDKYWT
jgi:hypothetical protein